MAPKVRLLDRAFWMAHSASDMFEGVVGVKLCDLQDRDDEEEEEDLGAPLPADPSCSSRTQSGKGWYWTTEPPALEMVTWGGKRELSEDCLRGSGLWSSGWGGPHEDDEDEGRVWKSSLEQQQQQQQGNKISKCPAVILIRCAAYFIT